MSAPPVNEGAITVAVTARFEGEIDAINGEPAFEAKILKLL